MKVKDLVIENMELKNKNTLLEQQLKEKAIVFYLIFLIIIYIIVK